MARTGEQRDRLIPTACRIVVEGGTWAAAAKAVDRTRATVYRWSKLPQWREAQRKLEAERKAILAELDVERRRASARRIQEIEAYRDELWDLAKRIKTKGDEILLNKVRAKMTSKREEVTLVDPKTGKAEKFDEVKIQRGDASADFAGRMLTGAGFRNLVEIAYGRHLVTQEQAAPGEEEEARRISITRHREETIERLRAEREDEKAAAG